MKKKYTRIIIAIMILTLILSLSLASYADSPSSNGTTTPENAVTIDASIVTLILAAAAICGGLFGYWLVKPKK